MIRRWLLLVYGQHVINVRRIEIINTLIAFRAKVQRWKSATLLPIDQLILTIAQDCFTNPIELALTYKLALVLKGAGQANPSWRLPELTRELEVIARNQRKFLGFSQEDTGFNPEKYKGKVVISTIHKAKGLEWDRVYLMSVNNYDFPSGIEGEQYLPEKRYIRGYLNLEAEALTQLNFLVSPGDQSWYEEGQATLDARLDYTRNRSSC